MTTHDPGGARNVGASRCSNIDSDSTANDLSRFQLFAATGAPETKALTVLPAGLLFQLEFPAQPRLSALSRLDQVLSGRPKIVRYIESAIHEEDDHA